MTAAISFENISKRHAGAAHMALDHVTLDVAERAFLAIVGPSGAGKSTLLRLINRLADPDEGVVRVEGEDVRHADPVELRRRIGYVFQGVGLFPHMTVAQNIGITPKLLGWEQQRIDARIDELIDLVRLKRSEHRDRMPAQLSGGERQRVGVARAIAAGPKIVLMDEPFGALDPLTRDGLGEDYRRLHDTLGLTTVMITHDTVEAALLADRMAVIRDGRIVAEGAPRTIADADDDYVRALMAAPRRQATRLRDLLGGDAP
jgi:osmoprotectant transport system ATP-binding protein